MLKRSYFTSITVSFISLLVLAEWSSADMTIDDMEFMYLMKKQFSMKVTMMIQIQVTPPPPKIFYLELKQPIDVKAGLQELSFDISIESGEGETDYFDVIVGGNNINIWNTDDGSLSLPWTTITHHIDSLGVQNLRFELRFDFMVDICRQKLS